MCFNCHYYLFDSQQQDQYFEEEGKKSLNLKQIGKRDEGNKMEKIMKQLRFLLGQVSKFFFF